MDEGRESNSFVHSQAEMFYKVKNLSQRVSHNPFLLSVHFVLFTYDERNMPSFDALDLIQIQNGTRYDMVKQWK